MSGPLETQARHDALVLADAIADALLCRILPAATTTEPDGPETVSDPWHDSPHNRREIHQATGIIVDQLDLPVGAAYARLSGYALATSTTMAVVAHERRHPRPVPSRTSHADLLGVHGGGSGPALLLSAGATLLADSAVSPSTPPLWPGGPAGSGTVVRSGNARGGSDDGGKSIRRYTATEPGEPAWANASWEHDRSGPVETYSGNTVYPRTG